MSEIEKPLALVVEDDDVQRMFLMQALIRFGYDVTATDNGMDALELCTEHTYDLVITDIRMPRLSGISFVKNVRMRNPKAFQRLIYISAVEDPSVRREASDSGASDVLLKPVSMDRLRQVLGIPSG
jgi:CheY-like chemotaxis protein